MTNRNLKLISKHAVLLSISYVIELVLRRYVNQMDLEFVTMEERGLISAAPLIFTFILNIISAVIVFRDKVTNKIQTKYVIVSTILYRPVGVVAFLLFSIYERDIEGAPQTNIE
jgi:hypothetical protein